MDHSYGIVPIYKDGERYKFLLVKSRAGHWNFPKGHAEAGESDVKAAARELQEETGIKNLELHEDIFFIQAYIRVDGPETISKTVKFYLGKVTDPTTHINDGDEIVDCRWEHFDEALALITHEESRKMLLEVKRYLGTVEI